MPVERLIGIDFGTSTSVVRIKTYSNGKPTGARETADHVSFNHKSSLPTLVYKTINGDYLVGYDAENVNIKGTLYQNFKLDLISADDEARERAFLLTEIFIKYLLCTFRIYLCTAKGKSI